MGNRPCEERSNKYRRIKLLTLSRVTVSEVCWETRPAAGTCGRELHPHRPLGVIPGPRGCHLCFGTNLPWAGFSHFSNKTDVSVKSGKVARAKTGAAKFPNDRDNSEGRSETRGVVQDGQGTVLEQQ